MILLDFSYDIGLQRLKYRLKNGVIAVLVLILNEYCKVFHTR